MEYYIKFKRPKSWFWRKELIEGHEYLAAADKMILYFTDNSREEVPEWSKCGVKLGSDFVMIMKQKMENEIGQEVKLKNK